MSPVGMRPSPLHIPDEPAVQEAVGRFVDLWSEMASSWGINKTMAQIHALLYALAVPMNTDQIMERLSISRGSANMNLRELVQWDLIHKVQIEGERKEFYQAETDIWTIVSTIVRERQQREIAPVRESLEAITRTELDSADLREFHLRIQSFIDFLEMFERFTSALLPYIDRSHLTFIKQMVKLAEAGQTLRGGRGKRMDSIADSRKKRT